MSDPRAAFTLRFDLRAPSFGAPAPDLHAAVPSMCAWAETRGAALAVLSEHHGTADGHLPSPLLMAAAVAAVTTRLPIMLAALVLPLYDPVRLAEDIAVLDNLSRGRVAYAFGIGHRAEEFEQFGVDGHRRGRIADAHLALVLDLLRGDVVHHAGRRIHVTPAPARMPRIMVAGGSAAAVRRAARHGLGFLAQRESAELRELFEAESRAHGYEPGPARFPEPGRPSVVFVADDVEQAWHELGPHLLHDARTAASYRAGDSGVASITRAETVEELRCAADTYLILTLAQAAARMQAGETLALHPLCGGLPPALAWPYLERAAAAATQSSPSP